ncbi:cation transporter [Caloramator sp. mosi_1]|uniref:cation transporter n=1 Tax=Caloramator sp. mosi_1 TaxID=3023090 RepID=UPI00308132C3
MVYNYYCKKIKSISLEADAWHHRSDAFSSVGTFIGIFVARLGYKFFDPLAAIIVSFL